MPLTPSPGASYGWRARIGLMWPSPAAEGIPYEFYLLAPDGVTVCLTSLGVQALTQEEYDGAVARIAGPLQQMMFRKVDAILQAGVPPIVSHGWGYQDEVTAAVKRITSIPFATDIMCCIEALQKLQMQRVVLLTPLDEKTQDDLTRFVKNAGIDVLASARVGPLQDYDVSFVPMAVPYRAAKELCQSVDRADGIWITGALMPSVSIIEPLEQDLGVPVVTSMQALTWTGLRLTGVETNNCGLGRLFKGQ